MRMALRIDVRWHAPRVLPFAGSSRSSGGLIAPDLRFERTGTRGDLLRKSTLQLRVVHWVVARIVALVRERTLCGYRQENQAMPAR